MKNDRPTRTPQESAEYLAESLRGFTTALNAVKRRFLWALLSVVSLALLFGLTLKFNYDGNKSRCETGNALRIELDEKFQHLADVLTAAGTGESPEGQELILILEEKLSLNDCGSINWLGR